jgi:hypothetical protein
LEITLTELLQALIENLQSSIEDVRSEAALKLVLVFEYNNIRGSNGYVIDDKLKISLDDKEQCGIALKLAMIYVENQLHIGEIFWILGKMKSVAIVAGMEKIISEASDTLKEPIVYQALIAVEKIFIDSVSTDLYRQTKINFQAFFKSQPIDYSENSLEVIHRFDTLLK